MVSQLFVDCIAGAISGMCSVLSGHPLDTLRTKVQVGSGAATAVAVRLVKSEGIAGLFRGVLPPLFAVGLGMYYSICVVSVYVLTHLRGGYLQPQPSLSPRTKRLSRTYSAFTPTASQSF